MEAGQIAMMKKIFKGVVLWKVVVLLIDRRLTTKKNISGMLNSFVFLIDLSHEFAHNQLFGKKVL